MNTVEPNVKHNRSIPLLVVSTFMAALAVFGCSDKQPAATTSTASAEKAATGKSQTTPSIDRNVPSSSYQLIQNAQQTVVLFHALNDAPLDLNKLIEGYSKEYRETPDAFKKQELVAKLTPEVEAAVAQARQNRYFVIELAPESLGNGVKSMLDHYDFKQKGFPVKAFLGTKTKDEYQAAADNGRTGPSDVPGVMLFPTRAHGEKAFGMLLENAAAFKIAPLADTERAKTIEELVTKKEPIAMRVYAFATTGSKSFMTAAPGGHVRFEVLKIEFIDSKKQVLFGV